METIPICFCVKPSLTHAPFTRQFSFVRIKEAMGSLGSTDQQVLLLRRTTRTALRNSVVAKPKCYMLSTLFLLLNHKQRQQASTPPCIFPYHTHTHIPKLDIP